MMLTPFQQQAQGKLKVAVVGLSHDHAHEIMRAFREDRIHLLGIAENNPDLVARYKKDYQVPETLFFPDTETMLKRVKPDVVMAYNPIDEHVAVAEVCLPMKIPLMVEKPLATTVADAQKMAKLAKDNDTHLLVNFETTWYASVQRLKSLVGKTGGGKSEVMKSGVSKSEEGKSGKGASGFGGITKIIAKDGHEGPKEIGCSKEFLEWLTDPVKNGGGAVMDFGCYGANLMTWLQEGKRPIAVTAVTKQLKPEVYPEVDDDATILVEYDDAVGIIEASWDWSYSIKSLDVYGAETSYHAPNGKTLTKKTGAVTSEKMTLTDDYYQDHIAYLEAVLSGKIAPENDLSSLANNLIVVEILEAAKKSAEEGRRIEL